MNLLNKTRGNVKKDKDTELFDYTTGDYTKLNTDQKRKLFYELFTQAYSDYTVQQDKMDKRDKMYFGNSFIDKSPNSKSTAKPMEANIVPNICYELIEAEKEMSIPTAVVSARSKNKTIQERMIRNALKFCKDELNMENMQDRIEQTTYTQGHSYAEVLWNNNYTFGGFPEIEEIHPKAIIPQPGVYELDKMDYFFIVRTRTKNFIKKKFGKDLILNNLGEQYPQFNNLGKQKGVNSNLVSEITVYYKDVDDNVGRFVFCQDTAFEDNPNIYDKTFKTCPKGCKAEDGTDIILPLSTEDDCPICSSKLAIKQSDSEILLSDVKKPGKTTDGMGKNVPEIIPAGTKVKLFNPKVYPLVQRINVPEPFVFGGHSDIDTIEDKQNALKKVATKIDEKINGSGAIITVPRELKKQINNGTYSIVEVSKPEQLAMIQVKDLKASIGEERVHQLDIREDAKNTLGVTNSWLGQPDPTATSGKAKQVQIQQSGGRFASKMVNKYKFYKDLYKVLFYFLVVFSDEPIYFGAEDDLDDGEADLFDKHILLEQDRDGNYFYDINYTIKSENVPDFSNDKQFLFDITLKLMTGQTPIINAKQGMKILKQLGFPLAETIINEAETEATNLLAQDKLGAGEINQEDIMRIMERLPKQQKEAYMNMSPEEQQAFIKEVLSQGGQAGGNPQQSSQPGNQIPV